MNNLLFLETILAYAYAVSLPTTLTGSWVILCIGLALAIVSTIFRWKVEKPSLPPFTVPILIFALSVFVSGFYHGGVTEALESVFSLKAIVVYFWGYHLFKSRRHLAFQALKILLVISGLAGVFGAIQQVGNFHPFGYKWLQGTGFLSGPMAYAGQMQMFSMLALAFALVPKFADGDTVLGFGRIRIYVLAFINCIGVLFAAERGAWLGWLAGAASLSAVKSPKTLIKAGCILAAIALFAFFFVPVVKQRIEPLANWQKDVSTRVRLMIWQESINVWQKSPVLGCGILNFPHFDIPEAIVPGRSEDLNHAHSNYFQVLSCLGVVGLLAYVFLFANILIKTFRGFFAFGSGDTTSGDQLGEKCLSLGLFAATVALLVSGIFEYNFGTAQVRLAQWFLLAMFVAPKTSARR